MKFPEIAFFVILSFVECDDSLVNFPNNCKVATENSTGISKILYEMREIAKPSRTIAPQSCNRVRDDCSFLECCWDEDAVKKKGKCILKDWVLPSGVALILAVLLSLIICCCCCCCSKKKKNQKYPIH